MKPYYFGMFLVFLGSAFYGLHETLMYHFGHFADKFPNADSQYWDPAISWKNKYCMYNYLCGERFIGSTTVFSFLTDAKHLCSSLFLFLWLIGATLAGGYYRFWRRNGWFWGVVFYVSLMYIAHGMGFHLVYTFFF